MMLTLNNLCFALRVIITYTSIKISLSLIINCIVLLYTSKGFYKDIIKSGYYANEIILRKHLQSIF